MPHQWHSRVSELSGSVRIGAYLLKLLAKECLSRLAEVLLVLC